MKRTDRAPSIEEVALKIIAENESVYCGFGINREALIGELAGCVAGSEVISVQDAISRSQQGGEKPYGKPLISEAIILKEKDDYAGFSVKPDNIFFDFKKLKNKVLTGGALTVGAADVTGFALLVLMLGVLNEAAQAIRIEIKKDLGMILYVAMGMVDDCWRVTKKDLYFSYLDFRKKRGFDDVSYDQFQRFLCDLESIEVIENLGDCIRLVERVKVGYRPALPPSTKL